jgi:hypothetical protein
MLQVAQSTMDQSRRPRHRPASDIALVEQRHTQYPQRSAADNPRAVDPGADDDQIERRGPVLRGYNQAALLMAGGTIAYLITSPRPMASNASITSTSGRSPVINASAGTMPLARSESAVSTYRGV